jgi:ketosteroid isomerase-like protein
MDTESTQRWLDAYRAAWESYDTAAIGALFTDDATYRWHPWDTGDDVARGREAIVASWLDEPDEAGSFSLEMRPLVVDGSRAVAVGTCCYYTDAGRSTLEKEFHNMWDLTFDDEGRCSAFTEWYMQTPGT